jgi:thymidine phosphorylase
MEFKKGSTFQFKINLTNTGGDPLEVDEVKSQVRTAGGKLVEELKVVDNGGGEYVFQSDGTDNYPVATLKTDIKATKDGVIRYSDTLDIVVKRSYTNG